MNVGIYTPYLDSFGGGERYMLTIAEMCSRKDEIELLLDGHLATLDPKKLREDLTKRFGLNLSNVKFKKAPVGKGSSLIKRLFFLRRYDVLIYLTDGSIFYSTAKKNFLHFQVPFKENTGKSLWNKIKLSSWHEVICNSKFTNYIVEQEWGIKGQVIYPPVDVENIHPGKKKKNILSVGRFASFLKSKKHEDMIGIFTKMCSEGKIKGWNLCLAGSVEGDPSYLDTLREKASNFPVTFYPNLPFNKLAELYGESSIYWHAAGLGESDPVKMEHFGITTVEAMAGGCVPVVINKGGQQEIVEEGFSGMLWNDLQELEEKTLQLVNSQQILKSLAGRAQQRAKLFSKECFVNQWQKLLNL